MSFTEAVLTVKPVSIVPVNVMRVWCCPYCVWDVTTGDSRRRILTADLSCRLGSQGRECVPGLLLVKASQIVTCEWNSVKGFTESNQTTRHIKAAISLFFSQGNQGDVNFLGWPTKTLLSLLHFITMKRLSFKEANHFHSWIFHATW